MRRHITGSLVIFAAALMAGHNAWSADAISEDVRVLKEQVAQLQAKIAALEKGIGDDLADPFDDQMDVLDRQAQAMMSLFGQPRHLPSRRQALAFTPDYDIKSTDKNYTISFDMPGMDKSKINVETRNGALLVSGERSSETKEDQGGKFYRQQRSFGYFSRTIPLPEDVKPETVAAKYENGVLIITVDRKDVKKQAPAQQKIEVK